MTTMPQLSSNAAQQGKPVRFEASSSANPSISDESARASTSTVGDLGSDSDSDSELSESSEDPSSESSGDDDSEDDAGDNAPTGARLREPRGRNGVINLRAGQGQKPKMKFNKNEFGPDIRDFLKDFLPQLKAANDELEAKRRAGTLKSREIEMTDADEQDECIEMDLGLGVLEEKDPNAQDSSASDSDEDMQDGDGERDVLGKLMGRAGTKEAVSIQEVRDAQQTS